MTSFHPQSQPLSWAATPDLATQPELAGTLSPASSSASLGQIQQLQQEVLTLLKQLDQSRQQESNWRKRYEIEAEQRRAEALLAQEAIAHLQAKIQQLQTPVSAATLEDIPQAIQQQVASYDTPEALQSRLAEVLLEREHLIRALNAEQLSHANTRHSLTTALGEAIDTFTRQRSREDLAE